MTSPLANLSGVFVKTCTVQVYTETQDESGEPVKSWTNLPGHIGLNCIVSEGSGGTKGETVKDNMTITFTPKEIMFLDSYPQITSKHRVVLDGVNYEIVADPDIDPLSYSTTLQVVRVR